MISRFAGALICLCAILLFGCEQHSNTETPALQLSENQTAAPTDVVQIAVTGMTCQNCADSISKTVTNLNGVSSCELTFDSKIATVTYDPAVVTPEVVTASITAMKYGAELAKPTAEATP